MSLVIRLLFQYPVEPDEWEDQPNQASTFMLIAAKSIPKYFHSLKFPVDILSETGRDVVFIVSRAELLALCDISSVIAIGSYNRIKYLRVNRPVQELENLRLKLGILPICEDSRNLIKDGKTFVFHKGRAGAFSPKLKREFV